MVKGVGKKEKNIFKWILGGLLVLAILFITFNMFFTGNVINITTNSTTNQSICKSAWQSCTINNTCCSGLSCQGGTCKTIVVSNVSINQTVNSTINQTTNLTLNQINNLINKSIKKGDNFTLGNYSVQYVNSTSLRNTNPLVKFNLLKPTFTPFEMNMVLTSTGIFVLKLDGITYNFKNITSAEINNFNIVLVNFSAPIITFNCIDSDMGKNYSLKGETYLKSSAPISSGFVQPKVTDSCRNSTALNETYCMNNSLKSLIINCSNGCKEGACALPPVIAPVVPVAPACKPRGAAATSKSQCCSKRIRYVWSWSFRFKKLCA